MAETILNTADLLPRQRWEQQNTPDAKYWGEVVEAAELFNTARTSTNPYARVDLQEALTTGTFNLLLSAAFEIEALAKYEAIETEWSQLFPRTTVKDFKKKTFRELFGGRDPLDKVEEGEQYKAKEKGEAEYEISVGKYGNVFELTWELIKNDELDQLAVLPDDLAESARATEDDTAFRVIVTETGPNTNYFRNAQAGEKRASNPVSHLPLTRENLEATYIAITKRKGPDNRPIRGLKGRRLRLVVPQALQFQAEALVNTPTIEVTEGSQKYFRPNPLNGKFDVFVSEWLSLIDGSETSDTSWYILPPKEIPRPAVAVAFMRGEEQPDIRVKADQGTRIGGGALGAQAGSYDNDTIGYRGRHVVGAAGLDVLPTFASDGAGS